MNTSPFRRDELQWCYLRKSNMLRFGYFVVKMAPNIRLSLCVLRPSISLNNCRTGHFSLLCVSYLHEIVFSASTTPDYCDEERIWGRGFSVSVGCRGIEGASFRTGFG